MKKLKTNPYGWPDKITAGNRGNKIQTAKKKDLSKRIAELKPMRITEGYCTAIESSIKEVGIYKSLFFSSRLTTHLD